MSFYNAQPCMIFNVAPFMRLRRDNFVVTDRPWLREVNVNDTENIISLQWLKSGHEARRNRESLLFF